MIVRAAVILAGLMTPATAGTTACAFYDAHGVVQVVGILDNDSDCETLSDGQWNEIRVALSAFGGAPKTVDEKLHIAWRMQEIVKGLRHER